MQKTTGLFPEQDLLTFVAKLGAFSYPDGDHYADQGQERLNAEKYFDDIGLRFGDVVVTEGEQGEDCGDKGQDVGGAGNSSIKGKCWSSLGTDK